MAHLRESQIVSKANESPYGHGDVNSNWRCIKSDHHRPNALNRNNLSQTSDHDDVKYSGEKDDDLESSHSVQTKAFVPNNTSHRYNRRYNRYNTSSGYNNQKPSYNRVHKQKHLTIKPGWKRIIYHPHNKNHTYKIAQMIKYGQRCRDNCTFTEYLIFYGTHVLHTNIHGDVIGLYEGGWLCWEKWFWYFMGGNIMYDLNVFNRIDLFGSSAVCGRNLCEDATGYAFILAICKRGWLDGLKYIVETLKFNQIDNQFELLVEAAYRFHADILRYLLIENEFYQYFDINGKKNKYGETLWDCCTKQFKNIIKPGSGWLHCLECLNYAPYLIYAVHRYMDNDEKDMEMGNEGEDINNWMVDEIDDAQFELNIETIEIPHQFVKERLDIIGDLIDNKPVTFKLESCYYGLCVDAGGSKPHCIHFWKPHIKRKAVDAHFFEYVPCHDADNNDEICWGRLRMTVSDQYWLTAIANKNMVKLCPIMTDDAQLWRIKQVELGNVDNIWIQIINKLGYKLIFSWQSTAHSLNSSMPVLSISNKVNEIDPLCIDLFSVSKNNMSTRYYFYGKKYGYKDILGGIAGTLNRNSFWRMLVDGSRFHPTKYQCYKKRLRNIARILWQFQQLYIGSSKM